MNSIHAGVSAALRSGDAVMRSAQVALMIVAGSVLLTISAKMQVWMVPVPMTLQSLVVLLIGGAYGPVLAAATVSAYLAQGAFGLPVFAGPMAGPAYFIGPTTGFLISFVPAAMVAGWAARRGAGLLRLGAGMLAAHGLIMAMGFVWLAFFAQLANGGIGLGTMAAWSRGIAPFLIGTLVKVALATALTSVLLSIRSRLS